MTQENKQLLFKVLCEMLPYGIICKASHGIGNTDKKHEYIGVLKFVGNCHGVIADYYEDLPHDTGLINNVFYDIEYIKPYLRPMSSMTEEEKEEERKLWDIVTTTRNDLHYLYTDFLVSHHFDYRGLIEKGFALEAPENMYK